ncbi:MAG TPA: hypothetical protein VFU36_15850 [Jatrophihabitans sp.]|nr:hypothetical protein [Jatrophihabitans sp.]
MPNQCDHHWSGLRCQLRAGHASAHAAREDDAVISWHGNGHDGRVVLDWAVRQDEDGHSADQPAGDAEPDRPADQ